MLLASLACCLVLSKSLIALVLRREALSSSRLFKLARHLFFLFCLFTGRKLKSA